MCKFEKITKNQLKESPSYIIATTILNQSNEFTVDKIVTDIKKKNTEVNVNDIIDKLNTLRDNGLIIEHGSFFSLREQHVCY